MDVNHSKELLTKIKRHSGLVSVDDYEVCIQHKEKDSRSFERGKLTQQTHQTETWVSLRVLLRSQPGCSTAIVTEDADLDELVRESVKSSEVSDPDPWFRFPIARLKTTEPAEETEQEFPGLLHRESEAIGFSERYARTKVFTLLWRGKERLKGSFVQRATEVQLKADNRPVFPSSVATTWKGHSGFLKSFADSLEIELDRDSTLPNDLGRCVVMRPQVFVQLLPVLASWFSADNVHNFRSPLSMNKSIKVSRQLSLVDDATLEEGAFSTPFDLEGTESRKTFLIREGVPEGLLYDSYWGARDNRPSTGNYRRIAGSLRAGIFPSNFYVPPSQKPLSFSSGVSLEHVESLSWAESKTELSLVGSGWIYESGQPKCFVTGLCIKCDVFELLRRVAEIGNDLVFYGYCGAPSILFNDLPLRIVR